MDNLEKKQYSVAGKEKKELEEKPIEQVELEEKIEGANQKINREKALEVLEKNEKRKEAIENTLASISSWSREDFEAQINNLETAIYELSLPNPDYLDKETLESLENLKADLNDQLQKIKFNLGAEIKNEETQKETKPKEVPEELQKNQTKEKAKKSLMGKVVNLFSFKRSSRESREDTEEQERKEAA